MGDARPITDECPYCAGVMRVTQMGCVRCKVRVEGDFPMSRLSRVPVEHQRFIEMFVLSGGNLKEMAEAVGVSYPTIRTRLDRVIESLRAEISKTQKVKGTVLDAMGDGLEGAARVIKDI